jgi:hypothetical protein
MERSYGYILAIVGDAGHRLIQVINAGTVKIRIENADKAK